jgi:hypothetical protein
MFLFLLCRQFDITTKCNTLFWTNTIFGSISFIDSINQKLFFTMYRYFKWLLSFVIEFLGVHSSLDTFLSLFKQLHSFLCLLLQYTHIDLWILVEIFNFKTNRSPVKSYHLSHSILECLFTFQIEWHLHWMVTLFISMVTSCWELAVCMSSFHFIL